MTVFNASRFRIAGSRPRGLSRRAWLQGVGGGALALPLLEMTAEAQLAQPPKRLVVVMHPQGTLLDAWTPSTTGPGFALPPILGPLERHRDRLLVLSGIDNVVRREQRRGNGHNPAGRTLFTCQPFQGSLNPDGSLKPEGEQVDDGPGAGPSFEQLISQRSASAVPFARLDYLAPSGGVGEYQCFWAAAGQAIRAEGDPSRALSRLFANFEEPEPPPEPSARERLSAHRGAVLGRVLAGLSRWSNEAGAADRVRLEAHAERLHALSSRLGSPPRAPSAGCEKPALSLPGGYSAGRESFLPESAAAFSELIAMGFACDLSRVATLQFSAYHDPRFQFTDATVPAPGYENWHEMVHLGAGDPTARAALQTGYTHYMRELAGLLDALDAVPEGDGTLLDHTLVLAVSEFGDGGAHSTRRLPVLLAGNLGGALQTGRHLSLPGRTTGDLFTTVLQLFGVEAASFGLSHGRDGSSLVSGPLDLSS